VGFAIQARDNRSFLWLKAYLLTERLEFTVEIEIRIEGSNHLLDERKILQPAHAFEKDLRSAQLHSEKTIGQMARIKSHLRRLPAEGREDNLQNLLRDQVLQALLTHIS